jgi:hypothetical protein
MEGTARVFAGEFCRSTLFFPPVDQGSPGWVVSPGGALCNQMHIAGVMTECVEIAGMLRCRVADQTGAFDVVSGGRTSALAQAMKKIAIPSFVAVSGYAQFYQKNGAVTITVRPEQVTEIDRASRDQFLLTTAEYTLRRLDCMQSVLNGSSADEQFLRTIRHYAVNQQLIQELLSMVEGVVHGIRPQESRTVGSPDTVRSEIMSLLQRGSGPRGIAVEEVIDTLGLSGHTKENVLAALESLIVDDECYQPQKGYVKLL